MQPSRSLAAFLAGSVSYGPDQESRRRRRVYLTQIFGHSLFRGFSGCAVSGMSTLH